MEFITIKSSHYESDLVVLKSKLESEGIQCFMRNELTTLVMSHMATFETELQVRAKDLDKARQIMKEMEIE